MNVLVCSTKFLKFLQICEKRGVVWASGAKPTALYESYRTEFDSPRNMQVTNGCLRFDNLGLIEYTYTYWPWRRAPW